MNHLSERSLFRKMAIKLKTPGSLTVVITIAVAVLASLYSGSYIFINTLVMGAMLAIMAMGLALIFSVMSVPNFAHGEFFMVGTLVSYYVFKPFIKITQQTGNPVLISLSPLITFFTATAVGVILGMFLEIALFRPLRRRSREQWVMNSFLLTLGVSVMLVNGHLLIFGTDFKGIINYWPYETIKILEVQTSFDRIVVLILSLCVILIFWAFMKSSKLGRSIRAVSQDETGAIMVGINVDAIQTITLALCCGLAALSGAFLLFMYPSHPSVGMAPLYNSWFIVILMGMGNVGGAAIGGFVVALFQVLTTVYIGEGWGLIIPAIAIAAILVIKPVGILGSPIRGILDK